MQPLSTLRLSHHIYHLSSLAVWDHILIRLQSQQQPVSHRDISTAGLALIEALQYTEEQRRCIEIATRHQSDSKQWFEEPKFRATASKFGIVVKYKRQHALLVSELLYSSINPSVTALQWGWQHESDVLHQYHQTLSSDLTLISARCFVDKCGYLGASPDGIVKDAAGQLVKLVEVKCPFKARDKTVKQACNNDKCFCCSIVNNTLLEVRPWLLLSNTVSDGHNRDTYMWLSCLDTKGYTCANNLFRQQILEQHMCT